MSTQRLPAARIYAVSMRWILLCAVGAVLAAACTPTTTDTTTLPGTSQPAPSTTTTAPAGDDACSGGGLAFTSDGLAAAVGDTGSDATRVGDVRWQPAGTCERFVFDFTTEAGSPATSLGLTGVTVLAGPGIVRISLPDPVLSTSVADLTTDGALTSKVFVVRESDGSLFLDIVGAPDVALAARAFAQPSPARLIIDIVAAADVPTPVGAAVSDVSVISSPLPGPALYPLTVEAYAKPSLRSVRILVSSGDTITVDRAIALSGETDAWQFFSTRLDDGPSGNATIFAGTADVNGRPDEGSTVAVDLP